MFFFLIICPILIWLKMVGGFFVRAHFLPLLLDDFADFLAVHVWVFLFQFPAGLLREENEWRERSLWRHHRLHGLNILTWRRSFLWIVVLVFFLLIAVLVLVNAIYLILRLSWAIGLLASWVTRGINMNGLLSVWGVRFWRIWRVLLVASGIQIA